MATSCSWSTVAVSSKERGLQRSAMNSWTGMEVCARVGAANLGLQMDFYHTHMTEGRLTDALTALAIEARAPGE